MAKRVIHERTGAAVVERLEVADTFLARARGLLGRRGLEEGRGLLIRPCRDVHTWFMRFPIDVVYLDGNGAVLKVVDCLPPWRFSLCGGAVEVLELPAGTAGRLGLRPGDRLRFEEVVESTCDGPNTA